VDRSVRDNAQLKLLVVSRQLPPSSNGDGTGRRGDKKAPVEVLRCCCRFVWLYSLGVQDYKNLKVWAKAHALMLNINRVARRFPREYSSLRTQLRRAAESIPTNIVEGSAFNSDKEFAKYLQASISSSSETEYHLRVARDYELLDQRTWSGLTADTCEVRMMLTGLIKKLRE